MKAEGIAVEGVAKRFRTVRRQVTALDNVSLEVAAGEFFVVLGPSGCGKSTLLNTIAGLEQPTAGRVRFGERVVASARPRVALTPKERGVAMVFQSYALYPHMDVRGNVAFPLKLAHLPGPEVEARVSRAARLLDIEQLLDSRPRELSGGQRQRVAIARALVREPSVFLLDEPLSNLDAQLRLRMRAELKRLQRTLAVTTVYVTHDQVEAMTLADRMAVMKNGKVQQVGRPTEVYRRPANSFVAGFIGTPPMNLSPGRLEKSDSDWRLAFADGTVSLSSAEASRWQVSPGLDVSAGIRPEDVVLTEESEGIPARVTLAENLGSDVILHLDAGGERILVRPHDAARFQEGSEVRVSIAPDKLHLFGPDGANLAKR
jgi:multiple sugar transport system ATP-binding protein